MNELCLWNVVEAVQDASESDVEAVSALIDLLLSARCRAAHARRTGRAPRRPAVQGPAARGVGGRSAGRI
jgi:hypothetical protein